MAAGFSFGQTFDSFTGTGDLSANGWTTASGTSGQIKILTTASDAGNSLSFTGLPASAGNRIALVAGESEDVKKALPQAISTGAAYFSALIKVDNTTGLEVNGSNGDYFLSLSQLFNGTAYYARLNIKQGATPNTFNLGILNAGGGTADPAFVATDLPVNTTVFAVVKYELATNTATLWVNPTPGGSEAGGTTNATGTEPAATTIEAFLIRQGGNVANGGTGNLQIDELRTGTAYASVTGGTASVKESAIAGLKVFPNPLKGNVLNITSDANATKTVAIFDVLGKQVVNTTTSATAINVSNLTSGVYIVKITEEGKTATKKLVVQ